MASSEHSQSAYLCTVMSAIIEGDAAAFEVLYRSTAPHVHSAARCILSCNEDANEVVAEVFVFVWRHAYRYDESRGSVTAWLGMIARRRAIDVLRRRAPTVSLDDERYAGLVDSLADAMSTAEDGAAQIQEATSVHVALSTLSPLRQKIIVQAFFRGLTHAEIADVMRMSLGTVKSHVRRGLSAMRGVIDPVAAIPAN